MPIDAVVTSQEDLVLRGEVVDDPTAKATGQPPARPAALGENAVVAGGVAGARTTKRRKVGRVKAPARESNRERAGVGRAWWARRSMRQAARASRACRRRRLRSRRRVRRAWLQR